MNYELPFILDLVKAKEKELKERMEMEQKLAANNKKTKKGLV